jgi:uncharacterized protein YegP (UPF0339 family)
MAKFVMKKDNAGEWRWNLKANNGEIIADSGEGYKNKGDCEHGIELVKAAGPDTPVEVEE